MSAHPLLAHFLSASEGSFPDVDGGVSYLPALPGNLRAVVAFTGHSFICTDEPIAPIKALNPDGFGAAQDPLVLLAVAGVGYSVGVLDATLVRLSEGGGSDLPLRRDLDDHPRVRHARAIRSSVRVFGDERGLITLSQGLAGRPEISVEVPTGSPAGAGSELILEGLRLAPEGVPIFAAVSPGNARSLRAFLGCGFQPIGSEVIISR